MKIVLFLLSIIAALVASANLVSASEDSLRSRSNEPLQAAADDFDSLEDVMVTMLRGAIENEDPEKLFGSELWDGLKDKLCFNIDKKQGEEEKALAGKFLLLFKLKKLLCDNGITTSTTSTTTGGETCENPEFCFVPGEQGECCPGRFVFVFDFLLKSEV